MGGIQTTLSRYLLVEIEADSPYGGGGDGEPIMQSSGYPGEEPGFDEGPEDPYTDAPEDDEPYEPLPPDGQPDGQEEGSDVPDGGEEQEVQGGEGNGEPEKTGDEPPEKPQPKGKTKGRIFN